MKRITALLLMSVLVLGLFTASVQAFASGSAENYPLNSIVIKIEDIVTHRMLGGARFEIYFNNGAVSGGYGTLIATVDSDSSGVIVISGLPSGYYIVRQTMPPNNYQLSINNEQHAYIKPDGTIIVELVFSNYRYGGLVTILTDKDTGAPIAGAKFSVTDVNNAAVGHMADGIYTTDSRGEFFLENLPAGDYKITQLNAAQGYAMDSVPNVRTVRLQHTSSDRSVFMATFENSPLGTLLVRLSDSVSKEPISGAVFNVRLSGGADLGNFTTGADGSFSLPRAERGTYIVSQVSATSGYLLATAAKTQYVNYVNTYALDFENQPRSGLYVAKYDKDTKAPLKDAKFSIYQGSTLLGSFATDADGTFHIPNLDPGWYTVVETAAPYGYILDDTPKSVQVTAETLHRLDFENSRLASLQIIKTDEWNGEPLAGARFLVTTQSGAFVGDISTDAGGKATIPSIEPGWYVITETKAPTGYLISEAARTVEVKATVPTVVNITNRTENSLQILKLDFFTRAPLPGASFRVEHANGATVGTYISDSAGKILIGNLKEGAYVISEIKAPDGYLLDAIPQTIVIEGGKLHAAEFLNKPMSGIQILKTDAQTGAPLQGAVFTIERPNGERVGGTNGRHTTDAAGKILVSPLDDGVYVISEIQAPAEYVLDAQPQTVEVKSGRLAFAEFVNKPFPYLHIRKIDSATRQLVAGAEFAVARANGEIIANVVSLASGAVSVKVPPGVYVITEVKAPDGYELNDPVQTVEVRADGSTVHSIGGASVPGNTVSFANNPLNTIEIVKLDAVTKNPLPGAMFTVDKANGERIGSYRTDSSGKILVTGVSEGTYVISETAAPNGYILNEAPKSVNVSGGRLVSVEFINKPMAGLQIKKIDSGTRQPIAGVSFSVSKMSGERIGEFATGSDGTIFLPELEQGWYTVTETKAASGYIIDGQPRNVEIKWGSPVTLTVENTSMSGLLIVKTDAATGKPLAGVVFEVRHANGQIVSSSIADGNQPDTVANSPNRNSEGGYTTDANGRIQINSLPAGEYHVMEKKALDGYELDAAVHTVTVAPGNLSTLQVTNAQKAGLRLLKIDSVTKRGIFGVEFMVFDASNKAVGTYITDNNGVIDFAGILPKGRYTVRETRAADGYYRDDMPRTVEFRSGRVTEVVWENTPQMGQIQIMKLSGEDNEVNGLPKGSPLAGAVFEVYHHRSGNLIDRFVSGTDGRAVSKPLPLGRYAVKEVQAPEWYRLSTESLDIEIEFATQIIKRDFLNYPANTGVTIRKTANNEAMPGDTIRYDIREARNDSTVQLTDFYWRDILPTDAARLEKIVTGTYNQSLRYKIIATTNKGDTRVIADNLSTTANNVIDCRPAALGLRNDEHITSFTLVFGTVKAGFCTVTAPQVFVTVEKNLPNGYQFANKADIGGKYGDEWVISNSTSVTEIYAQPSKMPRTGY